MFPNNIMTGLFNIYQLTHWRCYNDTEQYFSTHSPQTTISLQFYLCHASNII